MTNSAERKIDGDGAAPLAYPVSLFQFGHHHDTRTPLFPDHPPEVGKRLR